MIDLSTPPALQTLAPALDRFFSNAGEKIAAIDREYDDSQGSPVFTVGGKYTTRGWTEWTEGFRYGIAILHFDATGDESSLGSGRRRTVEKMASHVSHIGVHDHGFNNLSTYGNLRRLMLEGRLPENEWERHFYELALKVSGAVQAARWTERQGGGGFIHSFNGPHSLFVDTIRSCRILIQAHQLGHVLMGEGDKPISLLERALLHIESTAKYSVFYGEGRDIWDVPGRTTHEAIFNTKDGAYRCPNSQQGYTGFSTWTRGQAWAMLGFAEELELLATLSDAALEPFGGREKWESLMLRAATAIAENFIENTAADGISYWDQAGPNSHRLDLSQPADPFNEWEPVDSSASAITAQGLFRLARYLKEHRRPACESDAAERFEKAALVTAASLFSEAYASADPAHHGLLLHSIYHHPNGWDHRPEPDKVPYGESSMWGDYHVMELAVYLQRLIQKAPYLTFF
ncbi:glycosyl hydrolase [Haloferula sargassicola]|uniref:Unsaturated glucuronyl hydrolase n=1 Tax=Haloferula sargassicola TaxID=490096 RepID=A0ABP9UQG3_9BACT